VKRSAITWLALAALLGGCGKLDLSQPPNIRFGQEACAYCRMIISDERFAAAMVDEGGEVLKFDDIGCLVQHEAEHLRPGGVSWVRGFEGRSWLRAREATFVYSARVNSPMNHGLAAFSDAQAAGELANEPANRTMRFSELPHFVGQPLRELTSQSRRPQ
jgi:copper chaperone NosL